MTQLKFRVFHIDEMIYTDNYACGEFEFAFDEKGEMVFYAWSTEIHTLTPDGDVVSAGFEPYTQDIMQFTGMYDRNKKEIYDGDFLRNVEGDLRLVHYREGRWQADLKKRASSTGNALYLDGQPKDWEIVGNVYEHDVQTLIDEVV